MRSKHQWKDYEVVLMDEAIEKADIVVTATGNKDIVTADHEKNEDRSILCNMDTLIMKSS